MSEQFCQIDVFNFFDKFYLFNSMRNVAGCLFHFTLNGEREIGYLLYKEFRLEGSEIDSANIKNGQDLFDFFKKQGPMKALLKKDDKKIKCYTPENEKFECQWTCKVILVGEKSQVPLIKSLPNQYSVVETRLEAMDETIFFARLLVTSPGELKGEKVALNLRNLTSNGIPFHNWKHRPQILNSQVTCNVIKNNSQVFEDCDTTKNCNYYAPSASIVNSEENQESNTFKGKIFHIHKSPQGIGVGGYIETKGSVMIWFNREVVYLTGTCLKEENIIEEIEVGQEVMVHIDKNGKIPKFAKDDHSAKFIAKLVTIEEPDCTNSFFNHITQGKVVLGEIPIKIKPPSLMVMDIPEPIHLDRRGTRRMSSAIQTSVPEKKSKLISLMDIEFPEEIAVEAAKAKISKMESQSGVIRNELISIKFKEEKNNLIEKLSKILDGDVNQSPVKTFLDFQIGLELFQTITTELQKFSEFANEHTSEMKGVVDQANLQLLQSIVTNFNAKFSTIQKGLQQDQTLKPKTRKPIVYDIDVPKQTSNRTEEINEQNVIEYRSQKFGTEMSLAKRMPKTLKTLPQEIFSQEHFGNSVVQTKQRKTLLQNPPTLQPLMSIQVEKPTEKLQPPKPPRISQVLNEVSLDSYDKGDYRSNRYQPVQEVDESPEVICYSDTKATLNKTFGANTSYRTTKKQFESLELNMQNDFSIKHNQFAHPNLKAKQKPDVYNQFNYREDDLEASCEQSQLGFRNSFSNKIHELQHNNKHDSNSPKHHTGDRPTSSYYEDWIRHQEQFRLLEKTTSSDLLIGDESLNSFETSATVSRLKPDLRESDDKLMRCTIELKSFIYNMDFGQEKIKSPLQQHKQIIESHHPSRYERPFGDEIGFQSSRGVIKDSKHLMDLSFEDAKELHSRKLTSLAHKDDKDVEAGKQLMELALSQAIRKDSGQQLDTKTISLSEALLNAKVKKVPICTSLQELKKKFNIPEKRIDPQHQKPESDIRCLNATMPSTYSFDGPRKLPTCSVISEQDLELPELDPEIENSSWEGQNNAFQPRVFQNQSVRFQGDPRANPSFQGNRFQDHTNVNIGHSGQIGFSNKMDFNRGQGFTDTQRVQEQGNKKIGFY